MWCDSCRREVEFRTQADGPACAVCGYVLDPFAQTEPADPASRASGTQTAAGGRRSGMRLRIDPAHEGSRGDPGTQDRNSSSGGDEDVLPAHVSRRRSRGAGMFGSVMAYLGVFVLTAGGGLVLLGHFNGREDLRQTGWLVTTAGQMLLLLGVVTLVSGGMEETTSEVGAKVEQIASRLARIEDFIERSLGQRGFARGETRETRAESPRPAAPTGAATPPGDPHARLGELHRMIEEIGSDMDYDAT